MAWRFAIALVFLVLALPTMRAADVPLATNSTTYQELLQRLEASEARIRQLEAVLTAPNFEVVHPRFPGLASLLETADPEVAQARWQTQDAATKDDAKKKDDGKAKDDSKKPPEPEKPKKWYEKYTVRGYTQFRTNEVLWHQDGSAPPNYVTDRSVGEAQNFLIRRARIIVQGDVSDHLGFYFQPDFAITTPGSPDGTFFTQLRDLYGDVYVDKEKVHRFRVGQSKVPYGWENLQSSSNRIPLERTDALNSATPNERDLGVFYYWTPEYAQKFYRDVLDKGMKGSGNYGVFGFGAYNGQGGSFTEQNENLHLVTRLACPIQLDNCQLIELGIQGYTGKYTVLSSPIRANGQGASIRPANSLETGNRAGIREERIAGTFVLYPQPFGLQAEWNVGRGPALNDAQTAVEESSLTGGYVMALYKCDHCYGTTLPYVRYNYYRGGYKSQRNSPYAKVDEVEFGAEWQIMPAFELTCAYMITDRTNTTAIDRVGSVPYEQFVGHVLRVQFQINY